MVKSKDKKIVKATESKQVGAIAKPIVTPELIYELKADIARLKKDNEMLLQVAPKKNIARFLARNKEQAPTNVKLRMLNDKVIIGWRTTRDEVFKDMKSGKWLEFQIVELLFEDNTSVELPYSDYNRRYTYVNCRRTGTVTDDKGNIAFKLSRLDNGKKYVVDVKFVN